MTQNFTCTKKGEYLKILSILYYSAGVQLVSVYLPKIVRGTFTTIVVCVPLAIVVVGIFIAIINLLLVGCTVKKNTGEAAPEDKAAKATIFTTDCLKSSSKITGKPITPYKWIPFTVPKSSAELVVPVPLI